VEVGIIWNLQAGREGVEGKGKELKRNMGGGKTSAPGVQVSILGRKRRGIWGQKTSTVRGGETGVGEREVPAECKQPEYKPNQLKSQAGRLNWEGQVTIGLAIEDWILKERNSRGVSRRGGVKQESKFARQVPQKLAETKGEETKRDPGAKMIHPLIWGGVGEGKQGKGVSAQIRLIMGGINRGEGAAPRDTSRF